MLKCSRFCRWGISPNSDLWFESNRKKQGTRLGQIRVSTKHHCFSEEGSEGHKNERRGLPLEESPCDMRVRRKCS